MSIRTPYHPTTLAGIVLLSCADAHAENSGKIRFNEQIRPILSNTCFQCHGPDDKKRAADLRLDTLDGATKDLGGYSAISPGKPEQSALLERILSHDRDELMPPPKSKKAPLTDSEISLLREWIKQGAEYTGHWAFQPLSKSAPPLVKQAAWVRNDIDRFVLHKLESMGTHPSEEAPKSVLLRRVCLDLTGIPPTPQETAAFVADTSPDAYEKNVDRLLASPHYGERWGRHWLDQARYADSHGYSIDAQRDMWPYRDWVIRALNEDMPFNQFTIEQLAGDLLPNPSKTQLIATAFHRNTMINQEGGSNPEQFRNETVVDRVNTTGAVWLGLTVGCAQCHTHKYDPLTHQEYFKLFAFFNNSTDVNSLGETLDVVPGEILGEPKSGITPVQYQAAANSVAKLKREAPARQKQWIEKLQNGATGGDWRPAPIDSLVATSGRDFAIEENGYVRLSAGGKSKETITIRCGSLPDTIDALRLRISPDPAGEKIVPPSLSEFELLADEAPVPLVLATVEKDSTKNPARALIDGNSSTAWIPDAAFAKNGEFEVWLLPAEPLQTSGRSLSLRLRQESGVPLSGRFQIATATRAPLLPANPSQAETTTRAVLNLSKNRKLRAEETSQLAKAFASLDRIQAAAEWELEKLRRAATPASLMIMRELPVPRPTLLHLRGDYLNPDIQSGPLNADTPKVLPPLTPKSATATRLDLARWLVRDDNPLTPRVTVNRVWMHYFGTGLVETENDFGTQGSAPSHAELLDWLADEFIKKGWSYKQLHRSIVTSATYRQSSYNRPDIADKDPRNLWLARQNRVRLDAEIVRDSALQASGLLNTTLGGPPVFPPQPEGVYSFTQNAKVWSVSRGTDKYRRAIYTMFYRSAQHPLTSTFDAPNFSTTCTRRLRSNTPLQALMLANDEAFYEMAQAAAVRLWRDVSQPTPAAARARIARAFELFLCRKPSPEEVEKSVQFIARIQNELSHSGDVASNPAMPPALKVEGISSPEMNAWTALARGLMNTDEFINRE